MKQSQHHPPGKPVLRGQPLSRWEHKLIRSGMSKQPAWTHLHSSSNCPHPLYLPCGHVRTTPFFSRLHKLTSLNPLVPRQSRHARIVLDSHGMPTCSQRARSSTRKRANHVCRYFWFKGQMSPFLQTCVDTQLRDGQRTDDHTWSIFQKYLRFLLKPLNSELYQVMPTLAFTDAELLRITINVLTKLYLFQHKQCTNAVVQIQLRS